MVPSGKAQRVKDQIKAKIEPLGEAMIPQAGKGAGVRSLQSHAAGCCLLKV